MGSFSMRKFIDALFALVLGLLALPAAASNQEDGCFSGSTTRINLAIEIRQLYIMTEDPQLFVARFDMTYCWDKKQLTGFDPDEIIFLNALSDPQIRKLPQERQPEGLHLASRIYEARFMTISDTSGFPLDAHMLPIIFTFPEKRGLEIDLVVNDGDVEASSEALSEEQLAIRGVSFFEGQLFGTPRARSATFRQSSGSAYAIVVEAARAVSGPALIIWLPLLAVWIVSYTGLWWKDNGAVSRASVSALFTAVGLSLATMTLRPKGDALDGAILSFILIYINIVVIVLISLVAHRYGATDGFRVYRRLRWLGRFIIAPAMLIISIGFVAWWCSETGLQKERAEFFSHFKPTHPGTSG